jgi:hypothetical protein
VDVVCRPTELLEVRADRLGRNPRLAQRLDRRPFRPLRELAAVLAENQPVVDVLRRLSAERESQPPMELLVRPVVVATYDERDAEVDVVDDTREVIRRPPVLADQRDAVEPVAERLRGFAMPLGAVALPDRPFVPANAEPLEVAEDRLLAAGDVARRVRVVDPQEHPVRQATGRDGAQCVSDVERARRAWSEACSGLARHPDDANGRLRSPPVPRAFRPRA